MNEAGKGYVQINRKICETVWYTGCTSATVHLMIHLILSANFEHKVWRGINVERGELICSIGNMNHPGRLMEETRLPYSTLVRSLKKLQELGEITVSSKSGMHGYTLISITHYDTYTYVNTKVDKKANVKAEYSKEKEQIEQKEDDSTVIVDWGDD